MSKKALSPELQDQLDKLVALPDEQIDTADIPEASPEGWLHARRPDLQADQEARHTSPRYRCGGLV